MLGWGCPMTIHRGRIQGRSAPCSPRRSNATSLATGDPRPWFHDCPRMAARNGSTDDPVRSARLCLEIARSMQVYDVVIIGAGHNGLTCAAYLGMAGLKVKVVERRPVVGGAAVTEEFCPGFRNSVAAYTVSLLNPKIIADLAPRRSRSADRRTPRAEFPSHAGRPASARRRRSHRRQHRELQSCRCAPI